MLDILELLVVSVGGVVTLISLAYTIKFLRSSHTSYEVNRKVFSKLGDGRVREYKSQQAVIDDIPNWTVAVSQAAQVSEYNEIACLCSSLREILDYIEAYGSDVDLEGLAGEILEVADNTRVDLIFNCGISPSMVLWEISQYIRESGKDAELLETKSGIEKLVLRSEWEQQSEP